MTFTHIAPKPEFTEEDIQETVRELFEAANYVRANCPPEEYKVAVRDAVQLTRWHRERQQ